MHLQIRQSNLTTFLLYKNRLLNQKSKWTTGLLQRFWCHRLQPSSTCKLLNCSKFQSFSFLSFIISYIHRQFNYWSQRGISGPPPSLLNFGNLREFSTYGQPQIEMSWPKTYGSIYGFYQFTKPILTINEPELAKEIIVKVSQLLFEQISQIILLIDSELFFVYQSREKQL